MSTTPDAPKPGAVVVAVPPPKRKACEVSEDDHSIRCIVCKEIMIGEIMQCPEGHLMCRACSKDIYRCPYCQVRLDRPIRNRFLEEVVGRMGFTCTWGGCSFTGQGSEMEAHLASCWHRPYSCTICKGYTGGGSGLVEHLIKEHKAIPRCLKGFERENMRQLNLKCIPTHPIWRWVVDVGEGYHVLVALTIEQSETRMYVEMASICCNNQAPFDKPFFFSGTPVLQKGSFNTHTGGAGSATLVPVDAREGEVGMKKTRASWFFDMGRYDKEIKDDSYFFLISCGLVPPSRVVPPSLKPPGATGPRGPKQATVAQPKKPGEG